MEDKADKPRFFKKTFLVADTKFALILRIFFIRISNANVSFGEKILIEKSYTTTKTLSITEQI